MSNQSVPFTKEQIERIIDTYPTPFHIYDEKAIRENARRFYRAFDWVPGGFRNYFAVKALPNPRIIQILREEGMGTDCSSLPELVLSEMAGISGEEVMFTSNDTPATEYVRAKELGAVINLDDISHIDYLQENAGIPELICFRYNPGELKSGNDIIGKPTEAKYGFTRDQLFEGYKKVRDLGAKRFALHTMVASNELNPDYFIETAGLLFDTAVELKKELGIELEFVNLGGGIGIPYRPEEKPVDLEYVSEGIRKRYEKTIKPAGFDGMRIVMECGRMVTGPYGWLVTKVLHRKETYKTFIGLDSSMANLMRPALYGAYHHITVLGKEDAPATFTADITGSLCENNDKFAIDRKIPEVEIGDILAIHNTGAHGHAMGFNYNAKLRSAELLLKEDGSVELIRRAETVEDYLATLV
ncbi:diaminopimelate decarboxylase [Marispirochaeta aestuarii]|uniref:diaminopimelate decarboxylase family protein n=1 Tax=Marispirochaeta aestuarii TaxID=1963862 RepID=UPI0029C81985|nr:diaminopimelate decarboxylase [Marispirochaeta aestuarii]